MYSNIISLVLKDSDTDPEDVSLNKWPENIQFKGRIIDKWEIEHGLCACTER